MAANASEPNSINTAGIEPHFVPALARGKPFVFLDWLFQRMVKPISLSGYLSFIARFSFFVSFDWKFIDFIREVYLLLLEYSSSLVKNSCKKLSRIGVRVHAQKKRTSSSGCGRWEGELDRRTLPPVPRVLSFFSLLRFCTFQTACFPRPLQIWPNRGYFKSSVHSWMSKEEAVFSKL